MFEIQKILILSIIVTSGLPFEGLQLHPSNLKMAFIVQVPRIVFVIKCVEMICLESSAQNWFLKTQVLKLDVCNWFWNHKSWNQMSRIGFGITSLGIKCPELVLVSQVLESNVPNWIWNHKSWNQMSWNQVSGIGTVVMCQVIARL